ncbi:MAG: hypothetical protein JW795_23560 [Chitinivibrionales bacterium]|nr:hypothetical protein [Chitinivibrionales bacterium]
MTDGEKFLRNSVQRQFRRIGIYLTVHTVVSVVEILLIALVFIGVLLQIFDFSLPHMKAEGHFISISTLSTLFIIGMGGVYFWWKKEHFIKILIRIDRQLGLKDRLSSAYEFSRSSPGHNRFSRKVRIDPSILNLLLEDALQASIRIRYTTLFPRSFTKRRILLLAGVALWCGVTAYRTVYQAISHPGVVSATHAMQKEIARSLDKKLNKEKLVRHDSVSRRMQRFQRLSESLSSPSRSNQQRSETADSLAQLLQTDQMEIIKEIENQLRQHPGNTQSLRFVEGTQQQRHTQGMTAQQLLEQLQKTFLDSIPSHIKEKMDEFSDNEKIQKLLELSQAEPSADTGSSNRRQAQTMNGQGNRNLDKDQSEENEDENTNDTMKSDNDDQASDMDKNREFSDKSRSGKPDDAGAQGSGSEKEESDGSQVTHSSSEPGTSRSDKQALQPKSLEQAQGQTLMNMLRLAQRNKDRIIPIRSFPEKGRSTVTNKQIVKEYTSAIEQVISQESLPPEYRQAVKTYFLSIGL